MGKLVPSHAGSSFALARQLERGSGVGVLVDQKFRKGLKTKFFGQDVQTNPLLAKLVRQFNCEVYPARCIRLPGNRFRLELEPAIDIPRKPDGSCRRHRHGAGSQRQGGELGEGVSRAMAVVPRPLAHQALPVRLILLRTAKGDCRRRH